MPQQPAAPHAAEAVGVIGAGPGGLVAARYLKWRGFEPVLFERGERVGGQWATDDAYSGVWLSLRTNTSRVMTRFSDLAYPEGTPVYPTSLPVPADVLVYSREEWEGPHAGNAFHDRVVDEVVWVHRRDEVPYAG
jgi:cation diffusion facilitator CzcD-associated flavoprotein CzcO